MKGQQREKESEMGHEKWVNDWNDRGRERERESAQWCREKRGGEDRYC